MKSFISNSYITEAGLFSNFCGKTSLFLQAKNLGNKPVSQLFFYYFYQIKIYALETRIRLFCDSANRN
jgi:hypothetical protein